MKRCACMFLVCVAVRGYAQNLVPNGDLEQYTQCPDYVSQIDRAVGWSRPTEGTSDYLNACLGVPFSLNVPDNEFGYQPAHSGNGYAGFYCFYSTFPVITAPEPSHEYVTHALASPLSPGRTYSVEFFVSLADVSKYAVNDIGALLSMNIPARSDWLAVTMTPQVTNASLAMINDKDGWTRIQGCFVADSAFAYITIGNFHTGAATVFEEVPTNFPLTYYSYYYVDDVSVHALEPPELGPDTTVCGPVELSVMNPYTGATYLWSTGASGTTITVNDTGTYGVQLISHGCLLTDSVVVDLAQPMLLRMAADTSADLCASPVIRIGPDTLPTASTVLWNTGATSPIVGVTEAGTYSIAVSAPGYCPGGGSIQVVDLCETALYAPNAFTPNADGVNDHWLPIWVSNPGGTVEVQVFDRWGRSLYTSPGEGPPWDGTASGRPVPDGLYVWQARAHDPFRRLDQRSSGHVLLMR